MYPEFFSPEVQHLTEVQSVNFAQQLQREAIATPLRRAPITTAFCEAGTGDTPILCLPGFDSSAFEYRRLLPLLSAQYHSWVVDLLGFGFSDRPEDVAINPENIKIHLYHFWQEKIKKPMVLVGASMGGAAALDFTLTYPEAVAQLVLLDSAGLARKSLGGKIMFPPLDRWATQFLANPQVRQKISEKAYYDRRFASADAALCARLHLSCDRWAEALISFTKSGGYGSFGPQLGQLTQPSLVVWGRNDQILGTKAAHKFAKLLPQNQLRWLDRCGHVPHLEKPQETAQVIMEFLTPNPQPSTAHVH